MSQGQHLKTAAYSTPLFSNVLKAYPFCHPNSTTYLVLPGRQADESLFNKHANKFICPSFSNETNDCCFIVLEGECLEKYLLSKSRDSRNCVMTEE